MILNRSLPPSATHKVRSYDLLPLASEYADYVLVIRQGEAHRKNYSCERYFVQRLPRPAPEMIAFLVLRDSGDGDVYEVVLSPGSEGIAHGGYCTCTAGRTGNPCKHRDALLDATFNVGIPECENATALQTA